MRKSLTKEQFIERAILIHNNQYSYKDVDYINNSTKVKIICKIHGPFFQKPNSHIDGKCGCPSCGRNKSEISRRLTTEEFVTRAKAIHGDRYDYSNTTYVTNKTKIDIFCKLHGYFKQEAYSHINRSNSGCLYCGHLGISNKAIRWLIEIAQRQNINIQHAFNGKEFKIPKTRFKADGYCKETNTIYEFYGDRWHGNPAIYSSNEKCHPFSNYTAEQLFLKTQNREQQLKNLGYNVVSIWEQEYDKYTNERQSSKRKC